MKRSKKVLNNALNLNGLCSCVQYYIKNLLYGLDVSNPSGFDLASLVSRNTSNAGLTNINIENVWFNSENRLKRILFENFQLRYLPEAAKWASQFTWENTAKETKELYSEIP